MVYKIVTDIEQVDLNKLYQRTAKSDLELCLEGDNIYIYSPYNTQTSISMIMKKIGITNFFIKKVDAKPTDKNDMNFINSWVREKMEKDELLKFESERQSELQKMIDNIETVRQELYEKLENYKEVGDGRNSGSETQE